MESLALLVVYMALGIIAIVFIPVFILTRYFIKKKFPTMHWTWYFAIVPGAFVASFILGLQILRLITQLNA